MRHRDVRDVRRPDLITLRSRYGYFLCAECGRLVVTFSRRSQAWIDACLNARVLSLDQPSRRPAVQRDRQRTKRTPAGWQGRELDAEHRRVGGLASSTSAARRRPPTTATDFSHFRRRVRHSPGQQQRRLVASMIPENGNAPVARKLGVALGSALARTITDVEHQ